MSKINIPIKGGVLTLITGVENICFGLMGGIIAGLFPVEDREVFPQLQELIKYFTGELEIVDGELPESSVYLGPDPEKHLLFSRVDEEIKAQTGTNEDAGLILTRFGLESSFLRRKISTLSGGEKMKLALAITFSKSVECIVLHGVIPWLDKNGKKSLIRELRHKLGQGKSAVVFEQEISEIGEIAEKKFYFNGSEVKSFMQEYMSVKKEKVVDISAEIERKLLKRTNQKEILRFQSVHFGYRSDLEGDHVLKGVDFSLFGSKVYSLVGDNGTGKSTIARLILRIEKPVKGEIFFLGNRLSRMARAQLVKTICFVDQFPEQHIVMSSVEEYKKRAEKRKDAISKRLLDKYFDSEKIFPISILSPLELKLLSIASSVCEDTKLIVIDEPTWGIDLDGELVMLRIFYEIISELKDAALLIISHDLDFISRLNAEVLRLEDGIVRLYNSAESMREELQISGNV
jgi:ABC-type multidrug transport system ATPase subunit